MVCRIEDEGIGIEEQDIQHVYGNFYRSDALNHKHISGIGLGLSIAKNQQMPFMPNWKSKAFYTKARL